MNNKRIFNQVLRYCAKTPTTTKQQIQALALVNIKERRII